MEKPGEYAVCKHLTEPGWPVQRISGLRKERLPEALRVTFLLSGMPAYVYGRAQLDEVMP
jgi:hypothetical protein